MPLTYTRPFRVRHCECDVHEIARDATYLRFMQETAFDASAAAGYDRARYLALGRMWLIRETSIDFYAPLRFDDVVNVQTWVSDFRRVRSLRAYELRLAATDTLAAQAVTDWAFLENDTGRPAAIPPELVAAFLPEGLPSSSGSQPRQRFPAAPPAPPGVFTARRQVEWRDLDSAGHVNNAAYGDYVEDAARQAAAFYDWPAAAMTAEGFDLATHHLRIEYRLPALPGDALEVSTWLSELTADSAIRHTTVTRTADGELLARALARWGCVSISNRERIPLPRQLAQALLPNCAL